MTTIRLFARCRDSIRLLVLMMAIGLIALSGAALACGPASPGVSRCRRDGYGRSCQRSAATG